MTELTPKFRAFLLAALSLAVMAPMVWVVYWPARGAMDVSHYQIGRDFINDWAGPRLAFSGQVLKLFDLRAYAHLIGVQFGRPLPFHNWSYPPTALLLLAPFAALPYFAALALWTVGFLLIYLRASLSFVAPGRRRIALVLLVFAPATLINIVAGQNGFVTAALMLGGLAALERRPLLAGLLFGLLTTKPHLGFVLAFVLLSLGAWRTIAAAVATTMALVAASVLAFGVEPWRLFLTVTRGYQTYLLHDFAGFYTPMMASVMALARFNGVGYGPAWMVQGVASLIVIAAACWAVRRTRSVAMRALVVAVATPLATPYAFNYDLTAMSAMLAWRLCADAPLTSLQRGAYTVAWLAPTLMMLIGLHGVGLMAAAIAPALLVALLEIRDAGRTQEVAAGAAPVAAHVANMDGGACPA